MQENLDQRLQQRQARETGICPIREELYAQCFGMSVGCLWHVCFGLFVCIVLSVRNFMCNVSVCGVVFGMCDLLCLSDLSHSRETLCTMFRYDGLSLVCVICCVCVCEHWLSLLVLIVLKGTVCICFGMFDYVFVGYLWCLLV